MKRTGSIWRHCVLAALLCVLADGPPAAVAEVSTEARTPAEIYERKSTIVECVEFVATDLKARFDASPDGGPALMLLVVDPTTSMKRELGELRKAITRAWDVGPPGLRIGVFGIATGEYAAPSRIPREADGALATLLFLPVDGPKNIHAAVREAALRLEDAKGGPRALVLVTKEDGESEDDVEKTRDALFDAEAAFYCIAGEAAFERSWTQTFEPRAELEAAGLEERYHPEPSRKSRGALYYGGDTAFGLVPYRWEYDLAQSEYYWVRPPNYPVPSGFGYWSLATLSYTTGGRYFVFDFAAAALNAKANTKRKPMYEYSRLAHFAPDLRSRKKILKDLKKDWRARVILRIWEHLADEKAPVIQSLGTLETRGGMRTRPARPVRSESPPLAWYEELEDVARAREIAEGRIRQVHKALDWWRAANAKEREARPGEDPLLERVEADFQLLGVQLLKVHFHWHEALAALESIKPLDVTYRRARILPRPLQVGLARGDKKIELGSEERNARFAEALLASVRLENKYAGTPWALAMEKGRLMTFTKDVRVIEEPPERPDPKREKGGGKGGPAPKPPPPKPRPKPAPGPRPGSGTGGPTTGK